MLDKLELLAERCNRKRRELEYLLSVACRVKVILREYYEKASNSQV